MSKLNSEIHLFSHVNYFAYIMDGLMLTRLAVGVFLHNLTDIQAVCCEIYDA